MADRLLRRDHRAWYPGPAPTGADRAGSAMGRPPSFPEPSRAAPAAPEPSPAPKAPAHPVARRSPVKSIEAMGSDGRGDPSGPSILHVWRWARP
jgi:hypothetical protein